MIAIDFETTYDKKERLSVSIQGLYHYTHDPRFEAYMVSVIGEGLRYCGPVEEFDWYLVHDKEVCAHNARFDEGVFRACQETGQIPSDVQPKRWVCTADLAAYHGCSRDLARSSAILLGRPVDKTMRAKMDGLTLEDARKMGLEQELIDYTLNDSDRCLGIADAFLSTWPEWEQRLSEVNRAEGERGMRVDQDALHTGIKQLQRTLFNIEERIPWDWSKNKTPCSPKLMAQQARKEGIPAPTTTDRDEPACQEWLATYGAKHPWLQAIHDWRRAYTLLGHLETIQSRVRPDGTVAVDLLYFGAHTGRFSGSGGLNFLNLKREPVYFDQEKGHNVLEPALSDELQYFGIDERGLFIAREGCIFAIADMAQIEPRVLACLTNDHAFLKLCETQSPYEAHARLFMEWTGGKLKKENPNLYALAKARVLALGYGAGWMKFIQMAPTYISDPAILADIFLKPVTRKNTSDFLGYLESIAKFTGSKNPALQWDSLDRNTQLTWVNSWLQVCDFRAKNPRITSLWKQLNCAFQQSANTNEHRYDIELPSGRVLSYYNVVQFKGEIRAKAVRGSHPGYFYGGKLCENATQAVARDVFFHGYLKLIDAGYHIPLHVYDENVIEIPVGHPTDEIVSKMRARPEWFLDCPLDVELTLSPCYKK